MSITDAASPTYRRDLGEGLLVRWSTAADTEQIAQLCGRVFRDAEDEPLNTTLINFVHRQMSGTYPLMSPGDYAVIEDTSKEGNPIVACTCLWHIQWTYEGIPFGVGQPEFVATDPNYRNRGLIRTLFHMLHSRSEARGDLAQGITGIPYFYRQFGYEYAVELGGSRHVYLSQLPQNKENTPDPYTLRLATMEDIPRLMEIYNRYSSESMIWAVVPEAYWRYTVEASTYTVINDLHQPKVHVLIDNAGTVQGYCFTASKRREDKLIVTALRIAEGINWHEVALPLLRTLQSYGIQMATENAETPPLTTIVFELGSYHPIYDILDQSLAPLYKKPYAWYIRVPNLVAFLQHITPVLEQRLANSVAASYTGELKLNLYRDGVRMVIEKGKITRIEPWQPGLYKSTANVFCPQLVFNQLLFGYRNLDELRYAFPDVSTQGEGEVLIKALFPKKFSSVMLLG